MIYRLVYPLTTGTRPAVLAAFLSLVISIPVLAATGTESRYVTVTGLIIDIIGFAFIGAPFLKRRILFDDQMKDLSFKSWNLEINEDDWMRYWQLVSIRIGVGLVIAGFVLQALGTWW